MLGTLKKWGVNLTLKAKDLFTSSESQVYVKDLRKVMMYDGRKCQYPKNYDQIVKSWKIIEGKDEEGNSEYQLEYNKGKLGLALVKKIDNRSYFTIKLLVNPKRDKDFSRYGDYYKPFGFSKLDLRKCLPVFETEKTGNSQYPFELSHSSVLTKEVKNEEGKIQEVVDEKGRNGELLYTSDYKKLSTHFSEIRDQNGRRELDKSLISIPIVSAAGLAKVFAKLLTSLPMKLGEHLISKENPIAKSFGYLLFTPAMAVKNLVNIGATILKSPILLFVANEKKYGDAYLTMWKHQLKGCWEEAKSDFNVIKDGERQKPEQKDPYPRSIVGTWKELDAIKSKEAPNKNSENIIGKSRKLGIGENFKKNLQNEVITGLENHNSSETYVEKEQNRRNLQQGQGTARPL